MKNKLCDLSKSDIQKNISVLVNRIDRPRFICTKCARASRIDDMLCKAVKIKKVLYAKNG